MISINMKECVGCGICAKDCFPNNIEIKDKKAIVKNSICMKCGHCIAVCPTNSISLDEYEMGDVKEFNKDTFSIEPERLLNFIKYRRSVRQFKNQPVEDEKILNIIEAGRFTATASNSQNVSYVVVKEEVAKLRRLALKNLSDFARVSLSKHEISSVMKSYMERWIHMYESDIAMSGKNDSLFFNAPAILLIVSDSPVDAALAASNMELMTFAQGLGTFYSGFFVRAAQYNTTINEFLGLNESLKVMVCMVLGYPDVNYLRTVPRKQAKINWR